MNKELLIQGKTIREYWATYLRFVRPFYYMLLIMKITALFIVLFTFQASASLFGQNINLSYTKTSLKTVINAVSAQGKIDFVYKDRFLEQARPVTIELKNATLETALEQIFSGQPFQYKMEDGIVYLVPRPTEKESPAGGTQQQPIRGRVVNEKGEPLAGANVQVRSTKISVRTDEKGNFTLPNIDDKASIEISYVGYNVYQTKASTTYFTISLIPITTELEEVNIVNTGYQRIALERSAGSFGKPDHQIMRNRSTSMNVVQRLEGLIPGLTINNAPGEGGVLIRGLSSINSNVTPLVVVDGIPVSDINSLNPQDVEDVTVLKDAVAASIYGARASNGVIVISTKKGRSSEGLKINYDGFISFQGKPDLEYQPSLTSQQYIQAAREVFDPVVYPWSTVSAAPRGLLNVGIPPHEMILYNQYKGVITQAQANASLDSLANIDNRSQIENLWYRNASLMNHTLSLNGGGKVHSFYGSLAYTDTKSNRPGEKNRSYKINLRQDFNFTKFLKAYLITDLTNNIGSLPRHVSVTNRFYPYQLFQDAQGSSLSMSYLGAFSDDARLDASSRGRIDLDYFPLKDVYLADAKNNSLLNRITGGITIDLLKGLRYEGVYGYIRGHHKNTLYDDNTSFVQRHELLQFTVAADPSVTPVYHLPLTGGKFFASNSIQRDWTIRNQFVYDRTFAEGQHQLTALLGQEAQEQFTTTNENTVRGYSRQLRNGIPLDYAALSLGIHNPIFINNAGRSVLPADFYFEREAQTRFNSYYTNAAYTFARTYSLNASWRIDKSNLFGLDKGAQNRPLWSAGVRWFVSNESFLKNITVIDKLALRATYGVTGNAPIPGTASSYDILSSRSGASLPGGRSLLIETPGNPALSWESTETINFGVDFSVLNDRLSGSIDYYRKSTEDLIGQLAVSSLSGYSSIVGNFGNMRNNGIESSIISTNINKRDFKWSTRLSIAYNKNKITELKLPAPITTGGEMVNQIYYPGYSAFSVFAYQFAGLDNMGDPMIDRADGTKTKTRNVSMPEDILYLGTSQPPVSGGLTNTFTYKSLTLDFNAVFNFGHKMRRDVGNYFSGRLVGSNALALSAGRYTSAVNLNSGNIHSIFNERWRQPGDENITNVPSYVANTSLSNSRRDINYYVLGDLNVLDASYIKMRDITLSYSLPQNLVEAIHAGSVTFRMQVSNIMLWKANKYGIDPEFGARIRNMQRIITAGAHVSF
ncbi:SusC/RagA family TonB-linked outer membrane protein [Sphingobacterium faecale]|uniref:SusC/RagA family TonB-linked outer membrane protein n=1 Tax=Sphingobacterium faecale TaxID=2803775 RepID=A0ABS1QZJ8_9SPHI|nr:SusC/RagA family TonB-linked outer membrane protein [Sphingobacterium faecale]MBL1407212.1 SusC/RagA family TonB-linked outer membrane protein [Sphingobacterium faecale]